MNRLKEMGKWIVYGFAIFGALIFLSGGISIALRSESAHQEPERPKCAQIEFKAPRLNWQAADQKATEWLNRMAPLAPPPVNGQLPWWRQDSQAPYQPINTGILQSQMACEPYQQLFPAYCP